MKPTTSADIKKTLLRRCAGLGLPVSGIFELTPRCNLQCKMCYVRLTPSQMKPLGRELTTEQWIHLAQEAKDCGMAFLLLTGGEPTLREDFPELYKGLSQMGLSITVNTNATLLTPAIRELWHKSPPAQVNVTVYGTSREDYKALCGDPSAFDKMVNGVNWLVQEGILVHLNTTMVPENELKWLEIEEFAKKLGLSLRMTAYCFPPVRRMGCDACSEFSRLEPQQAAKLLIQDLQFREGDQGVMRYASDLSVPPSSGCDCGTGESIQCLAGRAQFWVAWNGAMTPCGMLPQPESQPAIAGFEAAWQELHRKTAEIRLCPDCVDCSIRSTCLNCAAVVYTETGTFTGKPVYMCQMNQALRDMLQDFANKH